MVTCVPGAPPPGVMLETCGPFTVYCATWLCHVFVAPAAAKPPAHTVSTAGSSATIVGAPHTTGSLGPSPSLNGCVPLANGTSRRLLSVAVPEATNVANSARGGSVLFECVYSTNTRPLTGAATTDGS